MLRFCVFDGETPSVPFPLRHAVLLGRDGIGLGTDIELDESGLIVCKSPEPTSYALSLQVPVRDIAPIKLDKTDAGQGATRETPSIGCVTLRTCLLPARDRPYLLSLELARHRIMHFLNKLEDWSLFDLKADDPIMQAFELARHVFTAALVAQRTDHDGPLGGFTPEADRLAWQALALAIDASEQLAMRHASVELPARLDGSTYKAAVDAYLAATGDPPPSGVPIIVQNSLGVTLPGRPIVGSAVNPSQFAEVFQRSAAVANDFLTLPMRWVDLEPEEGTYSFGTTDRWIEWAVRKARMPVFAGPVIDFRSSMIPEWIYIWENDYETLRELVYEHIKAIVTRYRRTVQRWTICSGLHVNSNFRLSYEQIMDLTRLCVLLVKKLQPSAKVLVEIDQPWGEHYARSRQSIPPALYADTVSQAGIPVDAYSIRLEMGLPMVGSSMRDLAEISSILDRYATLERPLFLNACCVPSQPAADQESELWPGYWREPMSESIQSAWLSNVASIALAKPFVQGLCWSRLMDPASPSAPAIGLVHADGSPKPALERFAGIRNALRSATPWLGTVNAAAASTAGRAG